MGRIKNNRRSQSSTRPNGVDRRCALLLAVALSLSLGCTSTLLRGSEQSSSESGPAIVVDEVRLEGTTLEPCEVSIDGEADCDGEADRKWEATKSVAGDDGSELTVTVKVQAADLGSGETHHRRVTLTLYDE